MTEQRVNRVENYMTSTAPEPQEAWMKGLVGLGNHHRSRKIQSSTGKMFGSI